MEVWKERRMKQILTLIGACAAVVGSAVAEPLKADDMARAPAVTDVTMSNEGDFLVGIVADPSDPDKKALASWDIANLDPNKPLGPAYITPTSGRMTFVSASAWKAGKVTVLANQPGTFNLNGCGEGKSTGGTKTWVFKSFLTDNTLKKLEDTNERRNMVGVSEITRRCLELAGSPSFQDLPLDPENVVVAEVEDASLQTRFSKLNLRTGRKTLLFRDSGAESVGLIDPRDGTLRTKQDDEEVAAGKYEVHTLILNEETGKFDVEEPLTWDTDTRHTVNVLAYDEQTGKYFVATDLFSDKVAIYLYDPRTDKFDDEVLFAHPDFDAAGVVLGRHASDFGKILGFTYLAADPEVYWVDPDMASIQKGLEAAFPGQSVALRHWTSDRNKVLFVAQSPRNPPSYYLLVNRNKVLGIGNERPWIDPEEMGPRELVYYDARDGKKIPGLLTLPPGFKKGDPAPPAVVLPHGGPWARDFIEWDFSGWTQYLATRGYAVLQPQYRGSEGWGHDLWISGDGEWGQKMQDDKDDGARWMIEQGYAKQGEIAIFGYSYGGFAAFAASVRPDGPFKCAIAGAGVSNLARIGQNWSENRLQRAYQGVTVKGMDPAQNTSKLSMPILIFHGANDVRVPLFHATDFYNAVKGTGKAKLVVLKDMGHQGILWTPDNTRESLEAIGSFLSNECGLGGAQ